MKKKMISNRDGQKEEGVLNLSDYAPLFVRVKELIKKQIINNTFKYDQPIPTEKDLADHFGVSVGTVKKACAELVYEGILYRKQGKGSFVAALDWKNSYIRYFKSSKKEEQNWEWKSEIIKFEIIRPSADVKKRLELIQNQKTIHCKRIRIWGKIKISLEDIYLPEDLFPNFDSEDFTQLPTYPIYEKKYKNPVINAEDFLRPGISNQDTAANLPINVGDPVIHVERIVKTYNNKPLEYMLGIGRGDRFCFHIVHR